MKQIFVLTALFALPFITACNTMEGMGTDIKKGGQKIENEAGEHKNY